MAVKLRELSLEAVTWESTVVPESAPGLGWPPGNRPGVFWSPFPFYLCTMWASCSGPIKGWQNIHKYY
jgi:hypothetical protein